MSIGDRVAAKMAEQGWSEGELSRRSKVPQPTVHRIITGESKSPRQSNIDSIAKALGVAVEFLWYGGEAKSMPPAEVRSSIADYTAAALVDDRFIVIPRFDISASMGPGVVVPEHLEVLQQLVVDREWIRDQRLNYSALPNLVVITGFGDSMLGTFSSGDPLLVDRGVNAMDKDGIYVFTRKDHLHIKRLQFIDGDKVLIISDNTTYKPYEVPLAEVSIHARVLIGLNVRKME
ncbi:XRE family transcriptional regulator [Pseudomonas oryzihabitans]|uniref:XRE family transcriptional regulator n=1 Tax=Pseudomonas oryzihabitans TaxID=47885 RepID=UPI003D03B586